MTKPLTTLDDATGYALRATSVAARLFDAEFERHWACIKRESLRVQCGRNNGTSIAASTPMAMITRGKSTMNFAFALKEARHCSYR
jgi:hypothetical protein